MKRTFRRTSLLLGAVLAFSCVQPVWAMPTAAQVQQQQTVIDVTDFGADPAGLSDSVEAVARAVEAARALNAPVTLKFPKGRYDFYPDRAEEKTVYLSNTVGAGSASTHRKYGIFLENMNNITIDGDGSAFVFHGKMTPFAAFNCENVTFKNYSIDFAVPTTVDMTVLERTSNSVTFHVADNQEYTINGTTLNWVSDVSPYSGQRYWSSNALMSWIQLIDQAQGIDYRVSSWNMFSNVSKLEEVEKGTMRITYSNTNFDARLQPGLTVQTRNPTRDETACAVLSCKDVVFENMEWRYCHGFGMLIQMCENVTCDGLIFAAPEGSARTTSMAADDLHLSGTKGKVEISNCYFHNPEDDPINVHGTFLQVKEKIASNKIRVRYMHGETAGFPNYFVGDEIQFVKKSDLIEVPGYYTVTKVDGPDGRGGNMGDGSGSLTDIILTLDQDIPSDIAVDQHMVENVTYTPEVSIHDCIFEDIPTRGILVTTRKPVVIENNTFDNIRMQAIFISNDAQSWYESGCVQDVLIRNNIFRNGKSADIAIGPTNPVVSTEKTVHSNIRIEDNTFYVENSSFYAAQSGETDNRIVNGVKQIVNAKSVRDLSIKNNRIVQSDPMQNITRQSDPIEMAAGQSVSAAVSGTPSIMNGRLFVLNGCKNTTISGNTYSSGLNPGISLSNMNASEVTIENDAAAAGSDVSLTYGFAPWYAVDDEAIASVSAAGLLTGRGAGTTVLHGGYEDNGRRYETITRTITVSASNVTPAQSLLLRASDGSAIAESYPAGTSLRVEAITDGQAQETPVLQLLDPISGGPSSIASLDDGMLSLNTAGLVLVRAFTLNLVQEALIRVVPASAEFVLPDGIEVQSAVSGALRVHEEGIDMQYVAGGLYQEQTPANLVLIDLPEGENKTVEVHVSGRGSSAWSDYGLHLFDGADNYVGIQRKNRGGGTPKVAMVREAAQSASESWFAGNTSVSSENNADTISDSDIWFKLEKSGDTVFGWYKTSENAGWTGPISVNGAFLSHGCKACLATQVSSGSDTAWLRYTDLKINGEPAAISAPVTVPLVRAVQLSQWEGVMTAALSMKTEDVEVLWQMEENGQWMTLEGLSGLSVTLPLKTNGQPVRALVYPKGGLRLNPLCSQNH